MVRYSCNEVAKVMFSQACVCPQGDVGCLVGAGLLPGGAWSQGGAWSWGVWSRGVVSQHALRQTPRERRLLLQMVRILLECILIEGG